MQLLYVRIHKRLPFVMRSSPKTSNTLSFTRKTHTTPKRVRTRVSLTRLFIPRASPVDIHFYGLTAMDIFMLSATQNMITLHLPCLFLYRQMLRLPWVYAASLTLFVSMLKTMIQLAEQ